MAGSRTGRFALLLCSAGILAACEKGNSFNFLKKNDPGPEVTLGATPSTSSVKLVQRDIEAPEVFQANDQGLWDGRPSLGGVWVAHPNVTDPERVIIRNEKNGKFVIGALFRRERDNPGPKMQVSSDAAAALGMLAGAPDRLSVIALRRQDVPIAEEDVAAAPAAALEAPETIETASLDPIEAAGAALDRVEHVSASVPAKATPAPTKPSSLAKPFIQIGLFSVQTNATNTGEALRTAGMVPTIQKNESKGKTYYRVTVGPATNAVERAALLTKVKGLGFSDAYFVTN